MRELAALAWIALVVVDAPARRLALAASTTEVPLRIECPVGRTTTVVFPERLEQLTAPQEGPIEVKVQRIRPEGALAIRPRQHPSTALLTFRGPTLSVRLRIESVRTADAADGTVTIEPPPTVAPAPVLVPMPSLPPSLGPTGGAPLSDGGRSPRPEPSPSAGPAVAAPLAAPSAAPPGPATSVPAFGLFDLEGLLRAKAVPIGRTEGLPGQPPMVLTDALQGDEWVWLRFELVGGASRRIGSVSLDQAATSAYRSEPAGKNLRVFVQIPRGRFSPRSRLVLSVVDGPSYTFALNAGRLGDVFKGLFR